METYLLGTLITSQTNHCIHSLILFHHQNTEELKTVRSHYVVLVPSSVIMSFLIYFYTMHMYVCHWVSVHSRTDHNVKVVTAAMHCRTDQNSSLYDHFLPLHPQHSSPAETQNQGACRPNLQESSPIVAPRFSLSKWVIPKYILFHLLHPSAIKEQQQQNHY